MKLMLSSKGFINEELTKIFLSFVGTKRKISIITTASQVYKEKNKNTVNLSSKLNELGFSTNFIDIEFEDPTILKESEIILVCGGNPYFLLHHIMKSNSGRILTEMIADKIPIWGISAGFMIFMKDLRIIDLLTPEMNRIGLKDKAGLGLIEEIVIPHYDRFIHEGKIRKEDIDKFELESTRTVVRLGEFQCLKYIDNTFEILGDKMKYEI